MAAISTFQCLPLHIAEAIASYCISTRLEIKDILDTFYKSKHVWTILYNVSRSWRELALKYFLSEITIDISVTKEKEILEFPCLPEDIKLDVVHYGYIKRVDIEVSDYEALQYTDALKDLSSAWPKDLVFPSARQLYVELSRLFYQNFDKDSTINNELLDWISQRIQTSFPKLQKVILNGCVIEAMRAMWSSDNEWRVDGFLSTIFGKATSFYISTDINMLNLVCSPSVVQNGTGLTSIGCSFTSKYELFLRIIEKSSSILESLEFEDDSLLNIRSLIFDEDYQPIVYPRLQRLDFSNKTGSMLDERLRVEKPIAPFPVLRHLKWNSMYVFEDDALFRGNSDTLEYMYIVVDTNLVDILQRHKVFCDGRYSQLCNVSVGMAEANDTRPLDTDVFLAFALRTIVPTTKALTLDLFDMFNIVDIASENQHLRNIQDLNLSGYIGSMRELIALIKLLPNMTKLTCNPEAIHLDPDSIQLSDLIDNLYTEYYPLSHRFRYWEVLVDSRQQVDHAATSALTFAILCTNFVLAYIPLGYREEFGQYIRNAIEGGQYDRHIDKIQRLFRILY